MRKQFKLPTMVVLTSMIALGFLACDREPPAPDLPGPTATVAPAAVLVPEPTATPTVSIPSPTIVPAPTDTPQPTATIAPAPTLTPHPTATTVPAPTRTPLPTSTTVPEPTDTPEPTATAVPAPTDTPEPTATAAPAATQTPQPTATAVPTPEPGADLDSPLPFDAAVVRGTLSNGLSYYIRHNEEPRDRAQITLVVKAGSVHETEEQRGLAHFVEHMAFNGTERFAKQEIISYLESIGSGLGADVNARTGFDDTLYFLEIPTDDPEITETAFRILSDWAYAVSFEPEEVELERGVVLEEWRLYQGFSSRLQDNLLRLLFGSSLYAHRSPIGLPEVIETAPVQLLRDYYERWYRPDLMAVVAVGDFDVEEIEGKVKQHFAPPPEGEAAQERAAASSTERPAIDVPGHEAPWIEVFTDPESPGTQLVLVHKLAPGAGQDHAAFRRMVVERLAFMMLNARLSERAQVADPPYLLADAGRSPYVEQLDILTFSAWVNPGGVERGLAAVLEELQRIGLHGFTKGELEREKSNLLRSEESAYKQRDQAPSQNFVDQYVDHFLSGKPAPGIEAEWALYQELLPQISLVDFDEVADSWNRSEDRALLVVRPEEMEGSSDDDLTAATLSQLEQARALVVEPYVDTLGDLTLMSAVPSPGSIVAEERIDSIDARRWTLSNGVTVIAKQTDFRDDEVEFRAFSPGGHSLAADEDHVSATYAAQLVGGSGVGAHDAVTLEKLLAGKRVTVAPFIGELFEGFSGSASPEDMETMFQLIALYATAPRLDPVFFASYEARLRSIAETRAAQPDAILFDAVNTIRRQSHFRARPLTVGLLEELDMESAEAVYAERFADLGDATFVFVGAFDWNELSSLTSTYLASLPNTGRSEEWRDLGIDPPPRTEDHFVRGGIEPRSRTVLLFTGDMEWSRREALELEVAGEMLGIRLRERVREQLGGTYSISVTARDSSLPDDEYRVYIIFGSDPSRTEELFGEVISEVKWLRAGGEREYLDKAKELLRTEREEDLRENRFWLNEIRDVVQRGESFEEITHFDTLLDELTLEEVAAAAQLYMTDDRYIRVVLLPEE